MKPLLDVAFVIKNGDPNREVLAIIPGLSCGWNSDNFGTMFKNDGNFTPCHIEACSKVYVNSNINECRELLDKLEANGIDVYVISADRITDSRYTEQRHHAELYNLQLSK